MHLVQQLIETIQGRTPSGSVPLPANEAERLESLRRAELLDTPADPRFDAFTRLAARLFAVPIALVTLVDRERQWFKAAIGFAQGAGTDRDTAFCSYAILDPTRPLVVADARDDPRFANNPLVTGPRGIRFYAGAPVLDVAGRALGTLCILDTTPRQLSSADIDTLRDLAFGVSSIIRMEQAAAAQRDAEEHHRWAVALSPQSQWVADPQGHILEISARLLEQLGMTVDEVHGDGWSRAVVPDDRARVREAWHHSLLTGQILDYEFRFCMADGTRRWVRSRAAPRRDEAGQIVRWYGTVEDIDDRKQIELAVEEGRQRLEAVLESTTDAVAFLDHDWRVTYLNSHLAQHQAYAGLLGRILWDAYPDLIGTAVERGLRQARESGLPVNFEFQSPRMGGWLDIHAYPTAQGVSVFVRNVNEQHRLRERMLHQARHDPLTGLPNRTFLQSKLWQRLDDDAGHEAGLVLLRLRLDGFRAATDTFGPAMGEALIRGAAERLRQCVTEGCFVARLDGPEFAVIPSRHRQDQELDALTAKLLDAVERPYALNDSTVRLQASIGIARAPQDALHADGLLQAAEIAMSQARRDGRQGCRRFAAGMLRSLEDRHRLLLDLREAVSYDELQLAYQPLVDFPEGRIGGFEALMRWTHPERGIVSPAEFIPVAKESGLIVELGACALRRACEEAKTWHTPVRVAVNLSPIQFRDPHLVTMIAGILDEVGLPASRLKLEVTETVLLEDSEANLRVLHGLKDLGVMVVLDDFGTGYSSLGYLQRFPFHKLKIDQRFVRTLLQQSESQAIVRSILDLARALHIGTTAEGIETEEQMRWLVREGCGQLQGYLLGRPMPAKEINGFLRDFVVPRLN